MFEKIIGCGLTVMFYATLASMAVFMVILPAVDIVREIIRGSRGR